MRANGLLIFTEVGSTQTDYGEIGHNQGEVYENADTYIAR